MKTAIFPGSFNPFHKGHEEVLLKALDVFDKVIVARGRNADKTNQMLEDEDERIAYRLRQAIPNSVHERVEVCSFEGFLVDFIKSKDAQAVVKGIRNSTDLEYERSMQYWNEDLGQIIPVFYIISGRDKSHISSSVIRGVNMLKERK